MFSGMQLLAYQILKCEVDTYDKYNGQSFKPMLVKISFENIIARNNIQIVSEA